MGGVIPPFGLFLLATLLGSGLGRDLARALLDGEVRLAVGILAGIDSLISMLLSGISMGTRAWPTVRHSRTRRSGRPFT
ncbi:hypothetical protein [Natrinema amylolyticum]|uniref:hypothetical protein n=1 Tax=Natrinema amylolyticum TaxID=2878679 RepID=UPI001CFB5254|nr:hypothetical protein [Natrinema amylolyticum]